MSEREMSLEELDAKLAALGPNEDAMLLRAILWRMMRAAKDAAIVEEAQK